jgi:hypothetical protein
MPAPGKMLMLKMVPVIHGDVVMDLSRIFLINSFSHGGRDGKKMIYQIIREKDGTRRFTFLSGASGGFTVVPRKRRWPIRAWGFSACWSRTGSTAAMWCAFC